MFISILLGGAAAFSALAIAIALVPPRAPVELAAELAHRGHPGLVQLRHQDGQALPKELGHHR